VGQLELPHVGPAQVDLVLTDGGEQRVGSEVVDPDAVLAAWLMGLLKHSPPTFTGAQELLSTRESTKILGPSPQRSTEANRRSPCSVECTWTSVGASPRLSKAEPACRPGGSPVEASILGRYVACSTRDDPP